ncbi:hypothetical protein ACVWZ4_001131 [Bradyrhizobium sp. USDA 4472]
MDPAYLLHHQAVQGVAVPIMKRAQVFAHWRA